MTFTRVTLKDDEQVVRLIKRRPSEVNRTPVIGPEDFDRVMHLHSGISVWRANSKARAMQAWNIKGWSKGILIASAGPIQALGLVFYEISPDHFSLRCNGCDLSQNQRGQQPLCAVADGVCEFAPAQFQTAPTTIAQVIPSGIREQMVPLFAVDTDPR